MKKLTTLLLAFLLAATHMNAVKVHTIAEKVHMTNTAIEHLALTPTLTIPAGETLHLRILPWHNLGEAKSGKYICVRNVRIDGKRIYSPTNSLGVTL